MEVFNGIADVRRRQGRFPEALGYTERYYAIAKQINNPEAVRAVGLANRSNPIAIVIPCHRVIAKDGDLQGYFYGLDMKRKLLELENPMSYGEQGSLF